MCGVKFWRIRGVPGLVGAGSACMEPLKLDLGGPLIIASGTRLCG